MKNWNRKEPAQLKTKMLTFECEPAVRERLEILAEKQERSRTWIIKKALDIGLKELEKK